MMFSIVINFKMDAAMDTKPEPELNSDASRAESTVNPYGIPRYQKANRNQVVIPFNLDSTLSDGHQARVVWAYVQELDLTPLYALIKAVEGGPGRNPIDPAILLSLWLYATLDGVGSARSVARLCMAHDAYRWICGGVSVNYHTLADFRVGHEAFLDNLLTVSVAALMNEGLVEMMRVAQDGVRVRASAGAASFRRKETLEDCLEEAQAQVEALKQEVLKDPAQCEKRHQAARERAARERAERVTKALEEVHKIEEKKKLEEEKKKPRASASTPEEIKIEEKKKKAEEKKKARASTTDPEAKIMKMADGGFRPAFNCQFATDTATLVIVGVSVDNIGSDQGQMSPMIEEIQNRYEHTPEEYLIDGGFSSHEEIEKVSDPMVGVTVFAPVPAPRNTERDPHEPLRTDSLPVAEWRKRMGTQEAKDIYKERAAVAECVNAQARNRNLQQFRVRGKKKVKSVLLYFVLAHNLIRTLALRLAASLNPRAPAVISV